MDNIALMAQPAGTNDDVFACVTYSILDFCYEVTATGPVDPEALLAFDALMEKASQWSRQSHAPISHWAQVVRNTKQLVLVVPHVGYRISDASAYHEKIHELGLALSCLKLCIAQPWELITVHFEFGWYSRIVAGRCGVVDLFLLDVKLDQSKTDPQVEQQNPFAHLDDPFAHTMFAYTTSECLNSSRSHKMIWPGNCGHFESYVFGRTAETFLNSRMLGTEPHTEQYVCAFEWRDPMAAERFKDPSTRCTGIEYQHPDRIPNDAWNKWFLEPLRQLNKVGVVLDVQQWTLDLHSGWRDANREAEEERTIQEAIRRWDRKKAAPQRQCVTL